jgi:hypothetical protein
MVGWMDERVDGWMGDGVLERWMDDGFVNGCLVVGSMDRCMDGWMNVWMVEWIEGWLDAE